MKTPIDENMKKLQSLLEKGTGAEVDVTTDPSLKALSYVNITIKVKEEDILAFIPIRQASLLRLTAINFLSKTTYFICFEDDLIEILKSNES